MREKSVSVTPTNIKFILPSSRQIFWNSIKMSNYMYLTRKALKIKLHREEKGNTNWSLMEKAERPHNFKDKFNVGSW